MPCLGTRVDKSRNCLIDFRRDMPRRMHEFFFYVECTSVNRPKGEVQWEVEE